MFVIILDKPVVLDGMPVKVIGPFPTLSKAQDYARTLNGTGVIEAIAPWVHR